VNLFSRKWKLNICTNDTDTDGLDVLKLIYGIKGHGIQQRKKGKQGTLHIYLQHLLSSIFMYFYLHVYVFFLITYVFFTVCILEYCWNEQCT